MRLYYKHGEDTLSFWTENASSRKKKKTANGRFYTKDTLSVRTSVCPSSERIEELWVVCGLYTERWSYCLVHGNVKNNRII